MGRDPPGHRTYVSRGGIAVLLTFARGEREREDASESAPEGLRTSGAVREPLPRRARDRFELKSNIDPPRQTPWEASAYTRKRSPWATTAAV